MTVSPASPEPRDSPDSPESPGPAASDELAERAGAGRRSRPMIAFLATGLVLVLGAGSLTGLRVLGVWAPDAGPAAGPPATPDPTATAAESPFAGTPAADFAEGAAGIVLPAAEPVGDFTAEEVADALAQVRRALIATRLDPTMLVDHDPDQFIELMAQGQQAALREAFDSASFATFASQLAHSVHLTAAPRVMGRIAYQAATAERDVRVLDVVTRFVWTYAFEATDGEPSQGVVVVRDELVWQMPHREDVLDPGRGLSLSDGASRAWGVDCNAYERGLLSPADPTGQDRYPGAAFDPELPLGSAGGC